MKVFVTATSCMFSRELTQVYQGLKTLVKKDGPCDYTEAESIGQALELVEQATDYHQFVVNTKTPKIEIYDDYRE